jgi:hypothetical protein
VINVVAIRRGEEEWKLDTNRSDVTKELKNMWGDEEWRLVDQAGTTVRY